MREKARCEVKETARQRVAIALFFIYSQSWNYENMELLLAFGTETSSYACKTKKKKLIIQK